MYLNHKSYVTLEKQQPSGITFRKAVNADASEISRQNMIYFGDDWEEEMRILKIMVFFCPKRKKNEA